MRYWLLLFAIVISSCCTFPTIKPEGSTFFKGKLIRVGPKPENVSNHQMHFLQDLEFQGIGADKSRIVFSIIYTGEDAAEKYSIGTKYIVEYIYMKSNAKETPLKIVEKVESCSSRKSR